MTDIESRVWHLWWGYASLFERAILTDHQYRPESGLPWSCSGFFRIVVPVRPKTTSELSKWCPFLAACLAEAHRRGFGMILFEEQGGRDPLLPVPFDAKYLPHPARRRIWALGQVAANLDLTGFEVGYAALFNELMETLYEPRVLFVEPGPNGTRPTRLSLHRGAGAATRSLVSKQDGTNFDQTYILDLDDITGSRPISAGTWEPLPGILDVPLCCGNCDSTDVLYTGDPDAKGAWIERDRRRLFIVDNAPVVVWTPHSTDTTPVCECYVCDWTGTPGELYRIYDSETPRDLHRLLGYVRTSFNLGT